MTKELFSGVATAIITPFKNDRIDYCAFERLIERQILSGIDAIVFCGTTGEATTLSEDEKITLYEFAVRTVKRRVPVICGTGSNSHSVTMRMSEKAVAAGADGLLCVSPYYNKGTDTGIEQCYREVCSLGIPVILYNIPSRACVDINRDILHNLSDEENLCGIKECAGIGRISDHKEFFGDRYSLYSGNDAELLPSLSVGADGVISVLSNIFPDRVKRIYTSYINHNNTDALKEHLALSGLTKLLFTETNPAPVKYGLSLLGLCENTLRLPMTAISDELSKKIENELKN